MHVGVPLVTFVVSLVFALTLLEQFLERRRAYQAAWTAGMFLFAAASLLHTLWAVGVYGEFIFRLWYLTGAMLVAAYLGLGSLYLHVPRKIAHASLGVLLALTVLSTAFSLVIQLRGDVALLEGRTLASVIPGADFERYYPSYVSVLTAVLNSVGAALLIGSAVYSAIVFARRRTAAYRVASNSLIAAGAFVAAAGGTLERFNAPEPHVLALLVGVVLIYLGFLRSQESFALFQLPFMRRMREAK